MLNRDKSVLGKWVSLFYTLLNLIQQYQGNIYVILKVEAKGLALKWYQRTIEICLQLQNKKKIYDDVISFKWNKSNFNGISLKVEKEQKSGLVNYYENIKKLKYILSPSFNINYIKPIYFNYQIPRSGDAQTFFQSYKYIRPPLLHDLNNIFCCLTYL